jgi:sugar lactone lactonase YvrE
MLRTLKATVLTRNRTVPVPALARRGLILAAVIGATALPASASAETKTFASGFNVANGIAVDPGGNVYVTDYDREEVRKFNSAGQSLATFGSEHLNEPYGIAVAPDGAIYVADAGDHRVVKFNASGGFVSALGGYASSGGGCSDSGFDRPKAVAVDPSGNVYVASSACVHEFDSSGALVAKWGSVGTGAGELMNAGGIALASDGGDIFVADMEWRVQRFTSAGVFQSQWSGLSGSGEPDVELDSAGNVYVGYNANGKRIERRSADGALLGTYEDSSSVRSNAALGVDSFDRIYVTVSEKVMRIDPRVPTPHLVGPSGPVLTGETVTFDASRSSVPFAEVASYDWDLDGDGAFEHSTGSSASTQTTYGERGRRTVTVRATAPSGMSRTAAVEVDVRPAPPAGAVGVSINNGAQFTNSPSVTLSAVWTPFAETVTVSNDGGFAGAQSVPVVATLGWLLDSSGPERLPKTIYARFDGSTQTFQDDIILDQVPPTVTSATASTLARARSVRAAGSGFRLALAGSDDNSGLSDVQFAQDPAAPGAFRPYVEQDTVDDLPRFVRLRDRAGNLSGWHPVSVNREPTVSVRRRRVRRGRPLVLAVDATKATAVVVKLVRGQRLIRKRSYELDPGLRRIRFSTARLRRGRYTLRVSIGGRVQKFAVRLR